MTFIWIFGLGTLTNWIKVLNSYLESFCFWTQHILKHGFVMFYKYNCSKYHKYRFLLGNSCRIEEIWIILNYVRHIFCCTHIYSNYIFVLAEAYLYLPAYYSITLYEVFICSKRNQITFYIRFPLQIYWH